MNDTFGKKGVDITQNNTQAHLIQSQPVFGTHHIA